MRGTPEAVGERWLIGMAPFSDRPVAPPRLHDAFCRCRACKPPLGPAVEPRRGRIVVAAIGGGFLVYALIVARAVMGV